MKFFQAASVFSTLERGGPSELPRVHVYWNTKARFSASLALNQKIRVTSGVVLANTGASHTEMATSDNLLETQEAVLCSTHPFDTQTGQSPS